jgi:RHH-type proline utilization regulon transcriptional repressor/proline dehydrogenase/delta 1-pyrroline-5-carboxylate dehydrogenase
MNDLEEKIKERGRRLFEAVGREKPPLFRGPTGWLLKRCMRDESFKTEILRFIENLPALTTPEETKQYLNNHFREPKIQNLPWPVRLFFQTVHHDNKLFTRLADKIIRLEAEKIARIFLLSDIPEKAFKTVRKLRSKGFACTIDIIGESATDEAEARACRRSHYGLLESLEKESSEWPAISCDASDLDWDCAPKIDIAIKPSSVCSTLRPDNLEKSAKDLCRCIEPILLKAKEINAFVWIDMEQYKLKNITLEAYRRLRSDLVFREFEHFGVAIQSYLRDTDRDIDNLLNWAREMNLPIAIRLVKGAYWDHEMLEAKKHGYEPPVYSIKAESDVAFERHARKIRENRDICYFACASHNLRSVAATEADEFQVLYGMGELVAKAILRNGGRVRLYCPMGKTLDGMAYLVRRILENTANESIMRQTFTEKTDIQRLLRNPLDVLGDETTN